MLRSSSIARCRVDLQALRALALPVAVRDEHPPSAARTTGPCDAASYPGRLLDAECGVADIALEASTQLASSFETQFRSPDPLAEYAKSTTSQPSSPIALAR